MLRTFWLCILMLGVMGVASAQFNAGLFYFSETTPLADACVGGTPYPDASVTVEIFWDQNDNGPDPTDEQPVVGDGFGQCNFNSFLINGEALFGFPGSFYTDGTFTIVTNTPQPSRYWLRICDEPNEIIWISSSFTITNGLRDYEIAAIAPFVCHDSICGGCLSPSAIQGFQASDNSCSQISLTWNPYPADQGVDSLFIYRSSDDTLVGRVHRSETTFTDFPSYGSYNYLISARGICTNPADTAYSAFSVQDGTRIQLPVPPADTSFTATASSFACGRIILQWTVPSSLASIDSFTIFENGVERKRVSPGNPNSVQRDSINTVLSGQQNYTMAGWSLVCGNGAQTIARAATAGLPEQITGLTASSGLCQVNLAWTAVPGATSYIVRRNGTSIGTPVMNSFSDNTATPNTVLSYTVSAMNTSLPPACQEGPQSTSANGSRIGAPTSPTSVVASDSAFCSHVVITWTDNSADEDSFYVRRDGVNIRAVVANTTNYNDSTAVPGTNHSYTVAARNICGTSAFATTNPGSKIPLPPQVLGVNATDGLADRVTVTWNNVIRETNFRILRDNISIGTVAADILTFDDFTGIAGVVYQYSVQAFNTCGDGLASAQTPGGVNPTLNRPTNVAATEILCDRVTITWTDNNSSPAETGHIIFRNSVSIGNVGANVTTFDDFTAIPGVMYTYNVQAEGPGGPAISLTPDNGGRAPLPSDPVLTLTDVTCDQIDLTWVAGANTDTVVFYRDGVFISAVPAQGGNSSFELPTDEFHSVYAIGANECGRGDTSNVLTVQRDQLPSGILDLVGTSTDCNTIQVTWTSPGDATSFDIYMDGVFISNVASFVTQPVGITTGNGPHTREIYFVSRNECGAGDTSNVIEVDVQQAPTVPTGVAASGSGCTEVVVTWNASSGQVDGYEIFRDGILLGAVNNVTLMFADTPGNYDTHQYSVVALSDNCMDSSPSASVNGKLIALLTPPDMVSATQGECEITISWNNITDETSYRIYRNGLFRAAVGADITEFVDDLATAYINYSYTVSATNICGEGDQGLSALGNRIAVPAIPTNVQASDSLCGQVLVTWNNVSNEDGYLIRRNGVVVGTVLTDVTQFLDLSVTGARAYRVQAFNICGAGFASLTDSGHTDIAPTMLSLTTSSPDCEGIMLTYNATANTDTVKIWRDAVLIAEQIGGNGSYEDFPPNAGTFVYSAQAIGDCGVSNVIGAVNGTLLEYPSGPTSLTAVQDSCETITINWTPASGDFGFYRVLRDGIEVATRANNATSFVDANAVGGLQYQYTVIAVNDTCGESADYDSVTSAIVLGSLPTAPEIVITIQNLDAVLSWSPVDTTLEGCAIAPSRYLVYYSENTNGPFFYHGSTTDTSYRHVEVVRFAADMYYQVETFVGPVTLISAMPEGGVLTRDEVSLKIRNGK